jgi:hypothetical protein
MVSELIRVRRSPLVMNGYAVAGIIIILVGVLLLFTVIGAPVGAFLVAGGLGVLIFLGFKKDVK